MTNSYFKKPLSKALTTAAFMLFASCSSQFSGAGSLDGESPGTPDLLGNVDFIEIGTPDGRTETVPVFPSQDDFEAAIDSAVTAATHLFQNVRQRCVELGDPSTELSDGLSGNIGGTQADRLDIECISGFYVSQENLEVQDDQGLVGFRLTGGYELRFVPLSRELNDLIFPRSQFDFTAFQLDALFSQTPIVEYVGDVFSFLNNSIGDVTDIEINMTATSEDGQTFLEFANAPIPHVLLCSSVACPDRARPVLGAESIICEESGCTQELCCESLCSFFSCPDSKAPVLGADSMRCPASGCSEDVCCESRCSSFSCPSQTLPVFDAATKLCPASGCSVDLCCEEYVNGIGR